MSRADVNVMEKESGVGLWWRSLRAYSLTVSALPPLVAFVYLEERGFPVPPGLGFLFLLTAVMIHLGTNVLNDYYDYINGVDTQASPGASGLLAHGLLSPAFFWWSGLVYFTLAVISGAWLIIASSSMTLLPLGVFSLLLAWFYTNRDFSFKYAGLGEPVVFILGGPLLMLPCGYLAGVGFDARLLLLSLPFGLITAAILLANNIRDVADDQRVGARTLPVRIGKDQARCLYLLIVFAAYALWLVGVLTGLLPRTVLLTAATLPFAFYLVRGLVSEFRRLDQATAKFHLLNSVIMLIAFLLW